jgi:hypothetical protein
MGLIASLRLALEALERFGSAFEIRQKEPRSVRVYRYRWHDQAEGRLSGAAPEGGPAIGLGIAPGLDPDHNRLESMRTKDSRSCYHCASSRIPQGDRLINRGRHKLTPLRVLINLLPDVSGFKRTISVLNLCMTASSLSFSHSPLFGM